MPIEAVLAHILDAAISGLVIALTLRFVQGKPKPERAPDHDARETAETALSAIARVRNDISELREHTLRDRDELRDIANKHEREFVQLRLYAKDAADRCMAEATKITMSMGNPGQRRA